MPKLYSDYLLSDTKFYPHGMYYVLRSVFFAATKILHHFLLIDIPSYAELVCFTLACLPA